MNTVYGEDINRIFFEDIDVQEAYIEARYRRKIAHQILAAMDKNGISHRDLAKSMNSSKSQVQRLLNKQRGGSLSLRTLVKAARVLGLRIEDMLS